MSYKSLITGIGVVSSLGTNYAEHEKNLFALEKGIIRQRFANSGQTLEAHVGKVKDDLPVPEQYKNSFRNLQFCILTVDEAIAAAKVNLEGKRVAFLMGTILGGQTVAQQTLYRYEAGDYHTDYDESAEKELPFIPAAILEHLGIKASVFVISTACSASNNAAILGAQLIQSGRYDVVIAGGTDQLADLTLAGFSSLGAINVEESAQPYSTGSGISLGEGAGFIVIENEIAAQGKKVYAEIVGGAISSDAHHITTPDPKGEGAEAAIDAALAQAGLSANDIDYINGHGTGTQANDGMEMNLLSAKFNCPTIVSSTKALLGHMLGAAGIIELINIVMMVDAHKVVGTLNAHAETENPLFPKNIVLDRKIHYAVNLSFAFGGNNSCAIIAAPGVYQKSPQLYQSFDNFRLVGFDATTLQDGKLVNPAAIESYAVKKAVGSRISGFEIIDLKLKERINPSLYRRLDDFSKVVIQSVARALKNSNLDYKKLNPNKTGILFSSLKGSGRAVEAIDRAIPQVGYTNVSAQVFPFTVLNAAAGIISQAFRIKGPVSVISAIGTGFSDIYEYAVPFVENADLDHLIVVNANQISDFSLFGLDELAVDDRLHDADFVSTFVFSRAETGLAKIVASQQVKAKNLTQSDLTNLVKDILFECKYNLGDITALIWNSNRRTKMSEYDEICNFVKDYKNFDLQELGFSTEGSGEELAYLLANVTQPGLYLILSFSFFGGYSLLLVDKA